MVSSTKPKFLVFFKIYFDFEILKVTCLVVDLIACHNDYKYWWNDEQKPRKETAFNDDGDGSAIIIVDNQQQEQQQRNDSKW